MNKKILSVVALVFQVVSMFLLYVNGTFVWHVYTWYENINTTSESFYWLIDTQFALGLLVWCVLGLIGLNVLVQIVTLFKNVEFFNKKQMIILPVITLLVFVALCMYGDAYTDVFVYQGEERHVAVSLGMMFYIECAVMVVSILIEGLKQFTSISKDNAGKTPLQAKALDIDELKKLKELLDEGVITQEEFEAKKKQILGL